MASFSSSKIFLFIFFSLLSLLNFANGRAIEVPAKRQIHQPGNAVATVVDQLGDRFSLFYEPGDGGLRRIYQFSNGTYGGFEDLVPPEQVAPETPIAATIFPILPIVDVQSQRYAVRVYFLDSDSYITEWCKDGDNGWYRGGFPARTVKAAVATKMAAVSWIENGNAWISVTYQTLDNSIHEWVFRGSQGWKYSTKLPITAMAGTGLAVINKRNPTREPSLRAFYVDPQGFMRNVVYDRSNGNGGWKVGVVKQYIGTSNGYWLTATSTIKQGGKAEVQIYWKEENNLISRRGYDDFDRNNNDVRWPNISKINVWGKTLERRELRVIRDTQVGAVSFEPFPGAIYVVTIMFYQPVEASIWDPFAPTPANFNVLTSFQGRDGYDEFNLRGRVNG